MCLLFSLSLYLYIQLSLSSSPPYTYYISIALHIYLILLNIHWPPSTYLSLSLSFNPSIGKRKKSSSISILVFYHIMNRAAKWLKTCCTNLFCCTFYEKQSRCSQADVCTFETVQMFVSRIFRSEEGDVQRALNQLEADHQSGPDVFGSVQVQVWLFFVIDAHQLGFRWEFLEDLQSSPAPSRHTYVFSHSGPIQAGAEKLGICGSVRGRLGTLGRGTLARLLVNDLPGRSQRRGWSMAKKKC